VANRLTLRAYHTLDKRPHERTLTVIRRTRTGGLLCTWGGDFYTVSTVGVVTPRVGPPWLDYAAIPAEVLGIGVRPQTGLR